MRLRTLLILIGAGASTTGLIGPTVFIDTAGGLNLFELSKRLNDDYSFWIGVAFAGVITLVLLSLFMRFIGLIWKLAFIGLALWSGGYLWFQDFHQQLVQQIQNVENKQEFINVMQALMVKNLNLQWGAYVLLGGFIVLFLTVFTRRH